MQFLYPTFLWALAALAIPIIIHLFSFKRFKKVLFSNVKLLEEIKEETSNRSKLKNLLTLLMRLLALACLVLAFAQPYIARENDIKKGKNAVSIFIDNSFSMEARSDETPLLEIAKAKAREIVSAYSEEDQYQILTHDFEGRHQRLLTSEDALNLIDEIQSTPAVKSFKQIYNRQVQTTARDADNQISYILSDFQNTLLPESEGEAYEILKDSLMEVNLVPIRTVIEQNISIDSAWLASPVPLINQSNPLIVKIKNHSDNDVNNLRLSYEKDGQTKPEGTLKVNANDYVIDTVNISILKPGMHNIALKITDYPIQFDDAYFLSFDVAEKINVLSINEAGQNKYLTAVFDGLNYYELSNQNINNLRYSDFANYELIVLNDITNISSGLSTELGQYVVNGGSVLVFPAADALRGNLNTFLSNLGTNNLSDWNTNKKATTSINTDEFTFKDVYENVRSNLKLPITQGNFTMTSFQSKGEEKLIRYRDGSAYLSKYKKGSGQVYICSSPLNTNYNDLAINAEIFVPLLYKSALSSGDNQPLSYTIGYNNAIEVDRRSITGDIVYEITGNSSFIPGQTTVGSKVLLDVKNQISTAGFYNLRLGQENVQSLAFNYDRRESDLSVASMDRLANLFGQSVNIIDNALLANFEQLIGEKDKGLQLWKWFLIACLIFLALESILLRFWKV